MSEPRYIIGETVWPGSSGNLRYRREILECATASEAFRIMKRWCGQLYIIQRYDKGPLRRELVRQPVGYDWGDEEPDVLLEGVPDHPCLGSI